MSYAALFDPGLSGFIGNLPDGPPDFPINIGLHQGSALSPYLFALVMDEVTRDIQGDIPCVCSLLMMWC